MQTFAHNKTNETQTFEREWIIRRNYIELFSPIFPPFFSKRRCLASMGCMVVKGSFVVCQLVQFFPSFFNDSTIVNRTNGRSYFFEGRGRKEGKEERDPRLAIKDEIVRPVGRMHGRKKTHKN